LSHQYAVLSEWQRHMRRDEPQIPEIEKVRLGYIAEPAERGQLSCSPGLPSQTGLQPKPTKGRQGCDL